jgi:hypothetical protein
MRFFCKSQKVYLLGLFDFPVNAPALKYMLTKSLSSKEFRAAKPLSLVVLCGNEAGRLESRDAEGVVLARKMVYTWIEHNCIKYIQLCIFVVQLACKRAASFVLHLPRAGADFAAKPYRLEYAVSIEVSSSVTNIVQHCTTHCTKRNQ